MEVIPVYRKQIARKRAQWMITQFEARTMNIKMIYNVLQNRKNLGVSKKTMKVLQKKNTAIDNFKLFKGKTKKDSTFGIFYMYADKNAQRKIDGISVKDSIVICEGIFLAYDDIYCKTVVFTYHSIKRMLERSNSKIHYTEQEMVDKLWHIAHTVYHHYHDYRMETDIEDIDPADRYEVIVDNLRIGYQLSADPELNISPMIKTMINIKPINYKQYEGT